MGKIYECKYLKGKRFQVFLKIADRIIPPDEKSFGGGIPEVVGIVDWALGKIEPGLKKRLLTFILVFEYMGFLFGGKPFSKLKPEQQDRQLAWLERSPLGILRMAFFGLKTYACMGYYSLEKVWNDIGYGGPLVPDRPFPDNTIRELQKGQLKVVG